MTQPVRLQLSRRKGYSLQAATIKANGLPAINVARPSRYGNRYKIGPGMTALECVEAFRDDCERSLALPRRREAMMQALAELRGKNLACWCKPGDPCHADVWLELANHPNNEAAS